MVIDFVAVLNSLSVRRLIFYSEADFQHALAWEIQTQAPEAQIRLEVPISSPSGRGALDLLIIYEGHRIGIELKYLKAHLQHTHEGEEFNLRETSASDQARYDVCKDVVRLEHLCGTGQIHYGFSIALTNEPKFWREDRAPSSIDVAFKLSHGRTLSGALAWASHAGSGTTAKRESTLVLTGTYALSWTEFSDLGGKKGQFLVLVIPISSEGMIGTEHEAMSILSPLMLMTRTRIEGRATLRALFQSADSDELILTFDEVEAMLGDLPNSAALHKAWWYHVESHPDAVWELEGFRASPDLSARCVRFRRRF